MTAIYRRFFLHLAVALFLCPLVASQAQQSSKRRIVEHSAPAYPMLARNMGLSGIVKLEATISPDGSVKNVDVTGGHPVLAQAAANAVRKWKWEPATHESHEPVEVKFDPEQ